jgi:hypothetical protein
MGKKENKNIFPLDRHIYMRFCSLLFATTAAAAALSSQQVKTKLFFWSLHLHSTSIKLLIV